MSLSTLPASTSSANMDEKLKTTLLRYVLMYGKNPRTFSWIESPLWEEAGDLYMAGYITCECELTEKGLAAWESLKDE